MNPKKVYQFFENVISLFSIKGIELVLTIWLIPYLVVKVGFDNYGAYAFALAFILLLQNVLNYGFNLTSVRSLAKNRQHPKKVNDLFNEVFSVKLFLLFLISLFYVVAVFLYPKFYAHKQLYFFGWLLLFGDLFSLRWFFLGMEQMKFKALINFVTTIFYVLLVLVWIHKPEDYIFILLAQGLSLSLVSLIAFVWVVYKFKISLKLISISAILGYLKMHFSSFLNLVIPSTFSVLAIFLVGVLGTPLQVSFTQIGVKVANMFCTVNSTFTLVFFPMVNRNKSVMYKSRVGLLFIGVVLSLCMYASSTFLIELWMPAESLEAKLSISTIVEVLSPLPLLVSVISAYGINGLVIYLKDALFGKITLSSLIIMVFLALIFIPKFHLIGGALALLGGRFFYALQSWYFFKRDIHE